MRFDRLRSRKLERNHRSSRRRLEPYAAVHEPRNLARDRQPEPASRGDTALDSVEALEYGLPLLRGDARPIVGDFELGTAPAHASSYDEPVSPYDQPPRGHGQPVSPYDGPPPADTRPVYEDEEGRPVYEDGTPVRRDAPPPY